MLQNLSFLLQTLAWPLALMLAWWLGEVLHDGPGLPRVVSYAMVGFSASAINLPGLTSDLSGLQFLANFTLALVLFELGYRINLRWLRTNPWVLITGVFQSALIFAGTWYVTGFFGLDADVRWIVSAVAMASSPAGIVRVANELHSTGQVTERVMHLCAITCLMTVLALKLLTSYWHLSTSGDWLAAVFDGIHPLLTSIVLGGVLGLVVPRMLRRRGKHSTSVTLLFTLAVLLLATASYGLKLSPLLAALVFGLVARKRRAHLTVSERGFGSLGDLLSVFLFVYVAALIEWQMVWASAALAGLLLLVRIGAATVSNVGLAYLSGITLRKGLLTGLALTPLSAYTILLLEQSRSFGLAPAVGAFQALAGLMLILEMIGPIVTQRSLMAARETQTDQKAAD